MDTVAQIHVLLDTHHVASFGERVFADVRCQGPWGEVILNGRRASNLTAGVPSEREGVWLSDTQAEAMGPQRQALGGRLEP